MIIRDCYVNDKCLVPLCGTQKGPVSLPHIDSLYLSKAMPKLSLFSFKWRKNHTFQQGRPKGLRNLPWSHRLLLDSWNYVVTKHRAGCGLRNCGMCFRSHYPFPKSSKTKKAKRCEFWWTILGIVYQDLSREFFFFTNVSSLSWREGMAAHKFIICERLTLEQSRTLRTQEDSPTQMLAGSN